MSDDTTGLPATEHAPATSEPEQRYGPIAITWELELLISGAVVFALLQLPGSLDLLIQRFEPQAGVTASMVITLGYFYAKCIVLVLIFSFLLHLAARAYWVGLIGLDSVFPKGIRWDQGTYGPIAADVLKRRLPTLPALVEKVDNFCSVIFACAFLVVFVFLLSIAGATLTGLVAYAVAKLLFDGLYISRISFSLLMVMVLVPMVPMMYDRARGATLPPGRTRNRIERWLNAAVTMQAMPIYGTNMLTLFTNVPKKVIYPAFYIAMFLTAGVVMIGLLTGGEPVRLRGELFVPDNPGSRGVSTMHYEDRRTEGSDLTVPTIQSDMITDPYVRLSIPYVARRLNRAIVRTCPNLEPFHGAGFRPTNAREAPAPDPRSAAVLACISRIHTVTIDGQVIPLDLKFSREATTGVTSLVGYIPTQGLAKGAHVIVVNRPPRWDSDAPDAKSQPRQPYYIWFWL